MAANTNALKTAQKDLQTAQKDLVAARKDIQIIVSGLKSLESAATATSTTP
jgi:hypothetical protein